MGRHRTVLLLGLITIFALALRLYQIDRESLWFDEAFAFWWGKTDPADLIKLLTRDVHVPFYYILLHYWMMIAGDSDGAVRLLSSIVGVATIPVVFQIGKLLYNERFGLVAALFLAVSGFHIQYSQEVRPYALSLFLTSLSVHFIIAACKRAKYAWVGYTISTALLLYTHNSVVPTVAATVLLYLVLSWPWKLSTLRPLAIAISLVALLYAPWLPVYLRQVKALGVFSWTTPLTMEYVFSTIQSLILFPHWVDIPRIAKIGLISVPLFMLLFSLPAVWAKERKTLIGLVLLFLIPIATNLVVSTMVLNIFIPRVLIPAVLPIVCFWASPIVLQRRETRRLYRNLGLAGMGLMWIISLACSIDFLRQNSKEPWRQAAAVLTEHYEPGDGLVYPLAYQELAFVRYLPPRLYDLPVIVVPGDAYVGATVLGPGHRQAPHLNNEGDDRTGTRALEAFKKTDGRIWLVWRKPGANNPNNQLLFNTTIAWLDANYRKIIDWNRESIGIALFDPLKTIEPSSLKQGGQFSEEVLPSASKH